MSRQVFEYIDQIERCPSIGAAWALIGEFVCVRGIARIGCGYARWPDKPPTEPAKPFVRGTFSKKNKTIGKRWSADGLFRRDPLVARAFASPSPFFWGTEFFGATKLDADVRTFYEALACDGARSMLMVPMRCDPERGLGIGLLGSDLPRPQFEAFIEEQGAALVLAVHHADHRMVNLSRAIDAAESSIAPLARREAECLELLTSGLSNSEIAKRMQITVHTVQAHLTTAKRKLRAATREQALARAIRFRVIRPEMGANAPK